MNRMKNQNGFTLIGVMLVLVILSVFGLSIVTLAMGSAKISSGERDEQSAYYIAEAGLTYELDKMEKGVKDLYDQTESEETFFNEIAHQFITSTPQDSAVEFEKSFGEEPEAEIEISEQSNENPRKYEIISTGTIGTKQRTVSLEFDIEWSPKGGGGYVPEMALLVKDSVVLWKGTINGDIGTHSTNKSSIKAIEGGGPSVDGSIYVPYGSESNAVEKPVHNQNIPEAQGKDLGKFPTLPEFFKYNKYNYEIRPDEIVKADEYNETKVIKNGDLLVTNDISNNYTLMMGGDNLEFTNITVSGYNTLNINIGNSEPIILVEDLNVDGHIRIKGSGKLTIYVKGNINFTGGSINENEDDDSVEDTVNKLDIYLEGSSESNPPKSLQMINGDHKVHGSLYAEDANIEMTGGTGFQGNIFTGGKSFIVSGGTFATSPLILAPKAKFEHTNGTIKGSVIAKSYEMTEGAELYYEPLDFTEGPISGGNPGDHNDEDHGGVTIHKQPIREN